MGAVFERDLCVYYLRYLYIYIPGTQMTLVYLVLVVKCLLLEGEKKPKAKDKQVPGIHIYIYINPKKQRLDPPKNRG